MAYFFLYNHYYFRKFWHFSFDLQMLQYVLFHFLGTCHYYHRIHFVILCFIILFCFTDSFICIVIIMLKHSDNFNYNYHRIYIFPSLYQLILASSFLYSHHYFRTFWQFYLSLQMLQHVLFNFLGTYHYYHKTYFVLCFFILFWLYLHFYLYNHYHLKTFWQFWCNLQMLQYLESLIYFWGTSGLFYIFYFFIFFSQYIAFSFLQLTLLP